MTDQLVVLVNAGAEPIAFHEEKRHESLARILAEIKEGVFGGKYDPAVHAGAQPYFVPHYTVVGTDTAGSIGMHSAGDLFGGVVPDWFVGTKAIVHDLIDSEAAKPEGWQSAFAKAVAPHVLPGYTAFDRDDAYKAGRRLLDRGPIRVKNVFAAGGMGQTVVRSATDLSSVLDDEFSGEGPHFSVVVELNLEDITTYSVGQVYVEGTTVSYWGTQRTTRDNSGNEVYGGSDLTLTRGGYDAVIAIAPTPETERAVQAAAAFDAATVTHYPPLFASRRNYDVAMGHDANGTLHCGVIDQSWRIGGTSGVEVLALQRFKDRPDIRLIQGSAFNVYGESAAAPHGAVIHYQGADGDGGPLIMYTVIDRA